MTAAEVGVSGAARHGTTAGYREDGCHCDKCRTAIAKNQNLYKMRRAARGGPLSESIIGSRRRLQALMALGWSRRVLAHRAGYRGDAFALILNSRRKRVTVATADKIRDLYNDLSMTLGPSQRARNEAQAKNWPPPLAWDDDRIDDPDHIPRGWNQPADPTAAKVEDYRFLARVEGLNRRQAAERMGITHKALEKAIERTQRRAS